MKPKLYLRLLKKIDELRSEITKQDPPRPYMLFWRARPLYDSQLHFTRFYTEEEMSAHADLLIGGRDSEDWEIYKTIELDPTPDQKRGT